MLKICALDWTLALIYVHVIAMRIVWSRSTRRPFHSCAIQDDHSLPSGIQSRGHYLCQQAQQQQQQQQQVNNGTEVNNYFDIFARLCPATKPTNQVNWAQICAKMNADYCEFMTLPPRSRCAIDMNQRGLTRMKSWKNNKFIMWTMLIGANYLGS